MKKNNPSKYLLLLFIILTFVSYLFLSSEIKLQQPLYCLDSENLSDGTQCSQITYCKNATCNPLFCAQYEAKENYCKTNFISVTPICTYGFWQEELNYCIEGEYCKDGTCIKTDDICGDNICIVGEDCFKDCGSISDWDKYTKSVSETEGMEVYLKSSKYYDYNNPTITNAIADMEAKYNPTTPYEYMKYATQYLYNQIDYVYGGVECPETAEMALQRRTGNCVDFSVVLISMMRAKGIPARQVEGCVSHDEWQCKTYAIVAIWDTDMEEIKLRAGNINEQQPLGHSWVEIFTPDEGWKTADPTVKDWISEDCIGYHKISHSVNEEKCYIENYDDIEFCRSY